MPLACLLDNSLNEAHLPIMIHYDFFLVEDDNQSYHIVSISQYPVTAQQLGFSLTVVTQILTHHIFTFNKSRYGHGPYTSELK